MTFLSIGGVEEFLVATPAEALCWRLYPWRTTWRGVRSRGGVLKSRSAALKKRASGRGADPLGGAGLLLVPVGRTTGAVTSAARSARPPDIIER